MSKFAKGNNSKKIKFNRLTTPTNSPVYLLIILYQLTKFEAPKYNAYLEILISSFQCPNLQRAINQTVFKKSPGKFEVPSFNTFSEYIVYKTALTI